MQIGVKVRKHRKYLVLIEHGYMVFRNRNFLRLIRQEQTSPEPDRTGGPIIRGEYVPPQR